jgi:hypothetical protein
MPNLDHDLARFRYHTGATLRRLAPEEPCPRLYRDIGPEAMARFLAGRLERLAGPLAPILYSRTAAYREPYRDHEPIGRLVFLQPRELHPWFSGVDQVYVAPVPCAGWSITVGFLPAHIDCVYAESLLDGVANLAEMREALGGRVYDDAVIETRLSLEQLNRELAETEIAAEPLRRRLQSREPVDAEAARAWLVGHSLGENDLCSAWHHLPRDRRDRLRDALGLPAHANRRSAR